MTKNPVTSCNKYGQCYFTHSINSLIEYYKEYVDKLKIKDVRYWADFHRGAHFGRITLAKEIIDDLESVLVALDETLLTSLGAFVKV